MFRREYKIIKKKKNKRSVAVKSSKVYCIDLLHVSKYRTKTFDSISPFTSKFTRKKKSY